MSVNKSFKPRLTRRAGKPENVAQAVLFLVDNDYITGISLPVDGGRSIYAGGFVTSIYLPCPLG